MVVILVGSLCYFPYTTRALTFFCEVVPLPLVLLFFLGHQNFLPAFGDLLNGVYRIVGLHARERPLPFALFFFYIRHNIVTYRRVLEYHTY